MADKFVTIKKMAEETGISEWAMRNLVNAGKVPYIKSGTRFLIPLNACHEALAELAKEQTAE